MKHIIRSHSTQNMAEEGERRCPPILPVILGHLAESHARLLELKGQQARENPRLSPSNEENDVE